jgi:transcriptional regulator with XRE-family HTH domain
MPVASIDSGMPFHARLSQAREAIRYSQAQLGEAVGAAQSTVATWERGKNEPDLSTIRRIAKVVNKTPEWLAFAVGADIAGDMVAVPEIDVRASAGPGGLLEALHGDAAAIRSRYMFPRPEFRAVFGADPEGVQVLEVIGDSMLRTLNPGEKVFVNVSDTIPSPPGIFVVWDGLGLVLKRVEFVPHSDPASVMISSDNQRYKPYERVLGEAYIQGRVIGSWQRR